MTGTAVVTVGLHWGWGVVGVSPVAKGHIVNTYPKVYTKNTALHATY